MQLSKHHRQVEAGSSEKDKTSGIWRLWYHKCFNDKLYTGSSKDVYKRYKRHIRTLSNGTHHHIYMPRSWNKCGEGCFIVTVIEELPFSDAETLHKREGFWIKELDPEYNIGSVRGGIIYPNILKGLEYPKYIVPIF